MFRSGDKRFEIFQETASLGSYGPGRTNIIRDVSAEAVLKIVVDGVAISTNYININTIETVWFSNETDGTYWSTKSYIAGQISEFELYGSGGNINSVEIFQHGKDREPIIQLVTRSAYVYGSLFMPSGGGLDRLPAGEVADSDLFNIIIPKRWKDCGVEKKDWLKDGDGNYYRVVSMRSYPDGHIELQVHQEKI